MSVKKVFKFKCCGVANYMDWHMIDAWPDKRWVPDTCCFPAELGPECGHKGSDVIYKTGCYEVIYKWFKERLLVIGLVGLTVAFVQVSICSNTTEKKLHI